MKIAMYGLAVTLGLILGGVWNAAVRHNYAVLWAYLGLAVFWVIAVALTRRQIRQEARR